MTSSSMIDVTATPVMRLTSAMLLYEVSGHQSRDAAMYATVHAVAPNEGGVPQIMEGQPLSVSALQTALRQVGALERPRLLPPSVLAVGRDLVLWWIPPTTRRAWFACEQNERLKAKSGLVPYPALVFAASQGNLYVHAIAGAERPTEKTRLYRCPCMNVWADGRVCMGTAPIPKNAGCESIQAYEAGFFRSRFTHPNDEVGLVKYEGGPYALWADLLEGKLSSFPEKALKATSLTLGGWLDRVGSGDNR